MGGHIPFTELGLTLFTPSKQHIVACLDTIFYDKTKKTITRRSKKWLKTTTHADVVTVTKNTVMEGTNKHLKFMAYISVAVAQANANNVDRLIENVEHHKEKMFKMKDTLIKERGEGIELKRNHEATLSEKERIQREYQALET